MSVLKPKAKPNSIANPDPDKICASVQRTQQAQSLIKNFMSQSRVKNEHPDKICASVQRTQQAQSLIKNLSTLIKYVRPFKERSKHSLLSTIS